MRFTPPDLFPSGFNAWTRIEPRCRSNDFSRGLAAGIADPLWMVGRQWQLGELRAEDAGSPVDVSFAYTTSAIRRLELGARSGGLGTAPLEVLVEREAIPVDWRASVRAGQQFERYLYAQLGDAAGTVIDRFRDRFPITVPTGDAAAVIDAATYRFLQIMSGRAIDGQVLLGTIDRTTTPPPVPSGVVLAAESVDGVRAALLRLVQWRSTFAQEPPAGSGSAWIPRQLEYRFGLAEHEGGGGQRLTAPHYRSGDLDWYVFDAEQSERRVVSARPAKATMVPTRVSFYGMPDARWWAFEEARTDFGRLDVARTDIAKLMLMEFGLVYGNDWFIMPLRLPIGTVTRIGSLDVLDVFGVHTPVERIASPDDSPLDAWNMFAVSSGDGGRFLLIPPIVERLESETQEEVRFLRDEGANMVFAVESTVMNGLGESLAGYEVQRDRRERALELADQQDIAAMSSLVQELQQLVSETAATAAGTMTPEAIAEHAEALRVQIDRISAQITARRPEAVASSQADASTLPRYRLATPVPDNWIPYLPVHQGTDYRSIALRQGTMLRNEAAAAPEPISPMSRLLGDGTLSSHEAWLNEECVPREGRRLTLTWRRARWIDGTTHLWLGRSVTLGRGEGSSGLRFDVF